MTVVHRIYLTTAILLALVPCTADAQDVKPRVAGLGGNAEYMQLLEREKELSMREDSLGGVITRLRDEFRTNSGERQEFAERIIGLENEVFEIRHQSGMVAARIGAIEEAFILENLQNQNTGIVEVETDDTGEQSANLADNDVFRRLLSGEDYAALLLAQTGERSAADMLLRYLENYDAIALLGTQYADANGAAAADSLFTRYLALDRANAEVADSLGAAWREIFDNKLFAYNYLLQTQDHQQLLARMEAAVRGARDEMARQRDGAASEEVVAYFEQKGLILEYETALADVFGLSAAADSLGRAAKIFKSLKRHLPNVDVKERIFIVYADIKVHSPALYNAANPIPEAEVYRRGVIYRIMLGGYTARQAVSAFKGLAPLSYLRTNGRWFYYAGGFADFGKAETSLADMKKRGFRGAGIVVWNNGKMLALDDKPTTGASWRVEIDGGRLSDNVRAAISGADSGVDISRSGEAFIVGPFPSPMEAERVADAVRKADPAISVQTVSN